MLLSHRRDPTIQLQVADSVRYREAVSRLKRILYNRPSSYERSVSPFSWKEKRYFPEEPQRTKEEFEKEIPDKNIDENQKSFSSLFDMIKRQDDLIAQLEKENLFLKTELVSTAEASKEIALQNESFRKRLTDTLIQMETSPDLSALTDADEKADEVINCLKDEREKLVECIKLQEETISNLRRRETEAIDKVKQAVTLAEDSQKLTDKVRESGDQNRKDLQQQLEDAFEKIQILQQQLHKSQERERAGERLLMDREKNLSRLEEDSRDKDLSLKKKELDYQNQIEDLKRCLKEAEEANERLEKVLQEQRNTSEATFKRLEALLDRRNLETESFTKRRKSLEKQVTDLKQENQRLLQAINDLAKVERTSNTDDVKYATQVSSSFPSSTKHDLNEIKSIIEDHQNSIAFLQEEVFAVRQEMTKEIEGLRNNMGELFSCLDKVKDESKEVKFSSLESEQPQKKKTDSLGQERFLNSSRSDGYESLREVSGHNSHFGSSFKEIPVTSEPKYKKDRSMKILTIPYSDDRRFGSQKINENDENEDEEYEVKDCSESFLYEDGLKSMSERGELEASVEQSSLEDFQSDYMEKNRAHERRDLNNTYESGNFEYTSKSSDSEISKKEIKTNFDEEKDRDESLPICDEKDKDESLIICDPKYNRESSVDRDIDETLDDAEAKCRKESVRSDEEKDKDESHEYNVGKNEFDSSKYFDEKDQQKIGKESDIEDEKLELNKEKYKDECFEDNEVKYEDKSLEKIESSNQRPNVFNDEKETEVLDSERNSEDKKADYDKDSPILVEEDKVTTKLDKEDKNTDISEAPNKIAVIDSTENNEFDRDQIQEENDYKNDQNDKMLSENNEQLVKEIENSKDAVENEQELANENRSEGEKDILTTKELERQEQDDEKDEEAVRENVNETVPEESENFVKADATTKENEVPELDTESREKEEQIQPKTDDSEEVTEN
ncbi:UNVERIFIED_CONTAM: hypothetical protein RMT77_003347 [Armadillidium vulgare]